MLTEHIAAPPEDQGWRYSIPPNRGVKMVLRTIGNVAVIGHWYGHLGQYFVAWSPLLKNSNRTTRTL